MTRSSPPVSLNPLATPVALNPTYVTKKTETLHMKGGVNGKWTITLEDGTLLFHIDGSCFSMSSQRTLEDDKGNAIYRCEIAKHLKQIYTSESLDGTPLWEMRLHTKLSGTETELTFPNAMNGGKMDQLDFKAHTYSKKKYVMYQGQEVAFIKGDRWSVTSQYDVTIAQVRYQSEKENFT
jgi:uncharacterized protein YxjI